jgi:hypothetical protein
MSIPNRRGPRALSEILGELFTVRGYGRLRVRQELEEAWNRAVGEPLCRQTQLGEVRRGVLNVTVSHSALLEELAAFRKPALLEALRAAALATPIQDIRFRVGRLEPEAFERPSPTVKGATLGQPRSLPAQRRSPRSTGPGPGRGPTQP